MRTDDQRRIIEVLLESRPDSAFRFPLTCGERPGRACAERTSHGPQVTLHPETDRKKRLTPGSPLANADRKLQYILDGPIHRASDRANRRGGPEGYKIL